MTELPSVVVIVATSTKHTIGQQESSLRRM
jgi:hypothetical protein